MAKMRVNILQYNGQLHYVDQFQQLQRLFHLSSLQRMFQIYFSPDIFLELIIIGIITILRIIIKCNVFVSRGILQKHLLQSIKLQSIIEYC